MRKGEPSKSLILLASNFRGNCGCVLTRARACWLAWFERSPMADTKLTHDDQPFEICPRCEGRGPFTAFITRSDGRNSVEELPCSFCDGTGDVTPYRANAYRKGHELMKLRQHYGCTVFDAAKLLGISSAEYSGIEHGRRPGDYEHIAQLIKERA